MDSRWTSLQVKKESLDILRIKLVILYRTILHNLAQSCTVLYLYNTGDLFTFRKIENVQVSVM